MHVALSIAFFVVQNTFDFVICGQPFKLFQMINDEYALLIRFPHQHTVLVTRVKNWNQFLKHVKNLLIISDL